MLISTTTREPIHRARGAFDAGGPDINYTPLANTNSTANRTLTATITDNNSSIPTSGIGLPVLYWKVNAGSYNSAQATFLGSDQYQFTFGSGVSSGDTVSYYVAAQDTKSNPNVSVNPRAGARFYSANPPVAGNPPNSPNTYSVLESISGIFTVGASGDYATLTAAVADLNSKFVAGPVVFNLLDATYAGSETFPIMINANSGFQRDQHGHHQTSGGGHRRHQRVLDQLYH